MNRLRPWLACALLLASLATILAPPGPAQAAKTNDDARPTSTLTLDGAVVIGASVSAGFGCLMPVDTTPPDAPPGAERQTAMGAVRLTDMLAAASIDPASKPQSWATLRFFQDPDRFADETLKKALAAKPKMVFAVDYLFWHAYGWTLDESSRSDKFERGLNRLEQFGANIPIVVGDLPDMRHASVMLKPEMVPSTETLRKLNSRLSDWAKDRPNIVLVPLGSFVKSAMSGEAVSMAGRDWSKDEVQTWLQGDGLHATPAGLAALTLDILNRMSEAKKLPEGAVYITDAKVLLERIKPVLPKKKPAEAK